MYTGVKGSIDRNVLRCRETDRLEIDAGWPRMEEVPLGSRVPRASRLFFFSVAADVSPRAILRFASSRNLPSGSPLLAESFPRGRFLSSLRLEKFPRTLFWKTVSPRAPPRRSALKGYRRCYVFLAGPRTIRSAFRHYDPFENTSSRRCAAAGACFGRILSFRRFASSD